MNRVWEDWTVGAVWDDSTLSGEVWDSWDDVGSGCCSSADLGCGDWPPESFQARPSTRRRRLFEVAVTEDQERIGPQYVC